ncbi:carbohydrate esterase family 3 protein [Parathielavia appendiculata]|uniref:Carbohydrate esterase family 3 protein n=1 Tax=Parathielavia appendiculata TaxID=2587402 RepID=A0AAN6TUY6_9PEZI|nr:carbohydrate esterase family 3 protein [Parathielavia appendiculata]
MDRFAIRQDVIKVMVVGDSISHGREGDWTWRYRIWEWFEQQEISVRFVGPYAGTSPPNKPQPPRPPRLIDQPPEPPPPLRTDGAYAEGVARRFLANSNHFAAGGRQTHQAKDIISEQVAAHQPDLCLVQLGFNDLGWRVSGPVETLASMKHLVDHARSAKTDLKFAIADVPYRTDLPGRGDLPVSTKIYNDMLAQSIPYWSTAKSPIALVQFCKNYSCGGSNSEAAYDGLHPNALGEYQIARAFSQTLVSDFNFGRSALVIPDKIPPRPLSTPANLRAAPAPSGIIITWDSVYGAFGYDLQHRLAGEGDWESTHVDCNRYDQQWLHKGQTVECRVRTSGGDTLKSAWTHIASAVANPQTAPAPINMVTHATSTGFSISWTNPPPPYAGDIDRYGITNFDSDQPGAFLCKVGVRGNQAEITGLTPGHRYYISMETWTTFGGGIPAAARAVLVGRGSPAVPTSLRARALDALAVELAWPEVLDAAGYDVWVRREGPIHGRLGVRLSPTLWPLPESMVHVSDGTIPGCKTMKAILPNMEPSVWDWEYAVEAYNGDDRSGLSEWLTPPPLAPEKMSLATTDLIHIELKHG